LPVVGGGVVAPGAVPPGAGEVVVVVFPELVAGAGAEVFGGIAPGVWTHPPFPGGTGVVWFGGVGPGVAGAGVCGVLGAVCGVSVPSPAALVVIGVGGPIGFVGGVIFGLLGAGVAFGAGAGAVGTELLVCGGVAVVVGAGVVGGGGVAARVRCATAQLARVRRAIRAISRFVMGFSS
jgi:hypothetical protein